MKKETAVVEVVRRSSKGISVEHRRVSIQVVASDDEWSYMSIPGVRPQNSYGHGSTRSRAKTHY